MLRRRPRVVVFYGGSLDNHDLSSATGRWLCHYLPREKYDVTPVEITADGQWKVPLGSLPRTGAIDTTMKMLGKAVRPLAPAAALQRLMAHPVDSLVTAVRGVGGDDGSLHNLGKFLDIPVVGSPPDTCQQTSNKHLFAQAIDDVANTPRSYRFRQNDSLEHILERAPDLFLPPFFVKPTNQEGSAGIEYVESLRDLSAAIARTQKFSDILLQEKMPGTEVAITILPDKNGKVRTLPPTIIVPQKSAYYDHLAKRRPGRVTLHTPTSSDNHLIGQAESIARDVYEELGCRGIATVDMMLGDNIVDVLEVNTIPTISEMTPLKHQFKAAGLHPTNTLDQLIWNSLEAGS